MKFGIAILSVVSSLSLGMRTVSAAVIDPISVSASDFYNDGSGTDVRSPDHTIDGSGLAGSDHTNDPSAIGDAPGQTFNGTMWLSNANSTPTITWNLGGLYNLSGLHLWNYNENNYRGMGQGAGNYDRGIRLVDVQVSATGLPGSFTDLGNQTFLEANGSTSYTGDDYGVLGSGSVALPAGGVQFVEFLVANNYSSGADPYTGISEIRFNGTAATPEPASIGLLGLGASALLGRRRKQLCA